MPNPDSRTEKERLQDLYSLNILQSEQDAVLDSFCEKVARLFSVPTCIVSLVLEEKQWFKSSYGCPEMLARSRETPRDISFCTHVVDSQRPLIVSDVSKDPRFSDNPLVKQYGFGFYAGFPLKTDRGHVLGSLCLYDIKPRLFTDREVELLGLFSERVMAHFELCRELERVRASEARFAGILEIADEAIISIDEHQRIILFNQGAERIFGYSTGEVIGQPLDILLPERFQDRHRRDVHHFGQSRVSSRLMGVRPEIVGRRKNGEEFPAEASISQLSLPGQKIFTAILRDITDRKRSEKALKAIMEGTSPTTGEQFFRSLVRHLADALDVRWAFISELLDPDGKRVRLIALWAGSGFGEVFEYDTKGTPCQDVFSQGICYYPERVQELFPEDAWLKENGVESYIAVPVHDTDGRPIGHVGMMDDHPMGSGKSAEMILRAFAGRAGGELKRLRIEQKEKEFRKLLECINDLQSHFITDASLSELFDKFLAGFLTLTQSEYGFIGEILKSEKGQPYLKTHAITNIAWNKETQALYEKHASAGLEFHNLNTLFGAVIKSGEAVISNEPGADPRRGGLPSGHPPLHRFLGLPLYKGGNLVGMVGLANRPGGYNQDLVDYLQPLLTTCANLIETYRNNLRRKQAEAALEEQAIRDPLTHLYNRRYFNQRMGEELSRADRNQQTLAILLCDLDRFKTINDTHGHQAGDEALIKVAQCIQESTRGTDLVFRWGGDEIIVILPDTNRDGVLVVTNRIRKAVQSASGQGRFNLDISIGVAMYPEHGRNIDDLIRLADRALYIAKKGGDKIHIGEEEYRLDERTIKVVFQPVVNLKSREVLGYEALSRDPQGKISILELFKRYQAIGQLTELKHLCFKLQLKASKQGGIKRVFINVDFELLSQIRPLPKPEGMEVVLEVSEMEALHDVQNHLQVAREWQFQGYRLAIDDFGAGFISLPFIAKLLPDYIKLDRSTLLQAVSSEKFRKFLKDLVRALRNYCKEGIIGEGIETEKELRVVKDLGIHIGQGFLLGRPQDLRRMK